jgi:hypothetical protein
MRSRSTKRDSKSALSFSSPNRRQQHRNRPLSGVISEDKSASTRDWSEQLGGRRILLLSRSVIVDRTVKADQRGSRTTSYAEKKAAFHSQHLHLG